MAALSKGEYSIGITRKVFWTFFALSVFALGYVNWTHDEHLRAFAELFPEVNLTVRKAFIHGYKPAMSVFIFLADIVLVGPFAYLSYFGDHISPKKGNFINYVSFFDLGILLAIVFTMSVISFNFTLVNAVDKNPVKIISSDWLWAMTFIGLVAWLIAAVLKTYSYDRDKRKDLKKYVIRF